ncbi:MAG: hypothetical protein M1821_007510 [Bathelium mastoideum]|nr:MAG: hypothetical protein M1821_007510 [Bathelium mastoideum]
MISSIVIVPGAWIEYPSEQFRKNCSWIKPLAASTTSDIRVFLFTYQLNIDDSSLWRQLLGQSSAVLDSLEQYRREPGYEQRPLLFICHSLGGLIIKKALTSAHQYQRIYEDVTAGIIFLGTPHLTSMVDDSWNNLKLIMKANRRDISKQNLTEEEQASIVTVCQRFQELQLPILVLSVYEGKETKVRENLLQSWRTHSKSSQTLITEKLATCNYRNESLFKVDSTHAELGNVEVDGPLYQCLVEFFQTLADNAPTQVALAFRKVSVEEHADLKLEPQSSISSFRGGAASAAESTPDSQLSELVDSQTSLTTKSAASGGNRQEAAGNELRGRLGVQFPFSHVATLCRNKDFFGQEHILDQIDQVFFRQKATRNRADASKGNEAEPRSFALCGMGGIGKTEVATEYVLSRQHKFDAVFWIYADTTQKLAAQFSAIAKELGLEEKDTNLDDVAAREMVKEWLAEPVGYYPREDAEDATEVTWLLVFDNADDPDVLYDWFPSQGPGSVLVTSRYPYMKENAHRLSVGLDVSPLEPTLGGKMLCKLSGREDDLDASGISTRIVERLGGLPLAVAQMSGIIRRKHLSLNEFDEYYTENAKNLHDLHIRGSLGSYQQTVSTTWAVEQLSPAAQAVLKVLSVLDPDQISEKILVEGAKKVALDDFPKTKAVYFEARTELIQTSLIARNMATSELRIHRLVQDVVRETMDQEQLRLIFAGAIVLLSSVWPYVSGTDPTRNQSWRYTVADRYTAHIIRLEKLFEEDIRSRSYDGTAESGILFSSFAWYSYEHGSYQFPIPFAEIAIIILQTAVDKDRGDEREVTHWLGEAYDSLSQTSIMTGVGDGMKDTKRWIQILFDRIQKYKLSSDSQALGIAYNQLAVSHISKGEVEDAINSWRLAYETIKSSKNAPQFSETWPAVNLALVLIQEGRASEVEEFLIPVLNEHEEVLGRDDNTTVESGQIWRTMGNLRVAQERYDEGLDFHKRALENLKAVVGIKHDFTGDCFYTVANDYLRQNDDIKALTALEGALVAYKDEYHKPQIARALWKKGLLAKSVGNTIEGDILLTRAIKLRRELQPDDKRPLEELTDKDWDNLVFYWHR